MAKRRKRTYTKSCRALITKEMWVLLQELKVKERRSKASIIRSAITEYYENHSNQEAFLC